MPSTVCFVHVEGISSAERLCWEEVHTIFGAITDDHISTKPPEKPSSGTMLVYKVGVGDIEIERDCRSDRYQWYTLGTDNLPLAKAASKLFKRYSFAHRIGHYDGKKAPYNKEWRRDIYVVHSGTIDDMLIGKKEFVLAHYYGTVPVSFYWNGRAHSGISCSGKFPS